MSEGVLPFLRENWMILLFVGGVLVAVGEARIRIDRLETDRRDYLDLKEEIARVDQRVSVQWPIVAKTRDRVTRLEAIVEGR